MVAASAHGTLGSVVVSVLVTVAVYWAADCYSRLLAARSSGRRAAVWIVLRLGWPMVRAAYAPLVVLLVVVLVTGNLRAGVIAANVLRPSNIDIASCILSSSRTTAVRARSASPTSRSPTSSGSRPRPTWSPR